ncbi:MAG: Stk1 family PASTA domain-containing Ser/Thr kinase [Rubrobacteraceae bacterium]|nr:Stk1 family PASTA domain-containing Ser/Thr kinase [Rubrobacteraceae bacterium]
MERTLIDNRYQLRALAGSGGMADVYLAYDKVLDRHVAIKLLKARYARDEEFVERFRREAKSAAALVNRYIVPIFDWGEAEDGTYYIVMEYVPEGDLGDRIKHEGKLSPGTAAEVALQVAEALQAAHKRGIIHRDVKPRNILLAGSGHIKVADFGIARAVESTTISHSGDILGSVKYMSPEQAAGERVGPESDLYSLGVVLYETLTGRVPFNVTSPANVAAEHTGGPPFRSRVLNPEVPEGMDAIVMRLLATDPQDRYGSADKLIEDLGPVRTGLPPVAPYPNEPSTTAPADAAAQTLKLPASDVATGSRTSTRRRRVFWLLTAFAILVAALGIGGYSLLRDGVPGVLGGSVGDSPQTSERARAGHEEVEVPSVKELGEQEARKRLGKAGFQVEVRPRDSPEEAAGRVLEQSVAGGNEARAGSKIMLTVGEGAQVARVPDLVGLTYSEAEGELERAGLPLGGVREVSSETVPAGVIASQNPQAGSTLERGSYVYLTTSIGPPAETTGSF